MGDLDKALTACEALLEQERKDGADEALITAKEAAIGRLASLVPQLSAMSPVEVEALWPRLQSVMVANRYDLKWSHLRAKLSQIGRPKPAQTGPSRPRVDLVH